MRERVQRFYIAEATEKDEFGLRVEGFVIPGNLRGLGRSC